jgi:hypothetical protein
MAGQRKRIGPLDTAGSVAIENAKVYKELRRGRLEPSLASRLSQILINQRVIIVNKSVITGKRYEDHLRDAGFQTEVIPNAGAGRCPNADRGGAKDSAPLPF